MVVKLSLIHISELWKNSGDGCTDRGIVVCDQDQITADAGHKRQAHPPPSIGHHPFWRINMIQSNRRSFKNKPLSNIQQAQFSIGWRFCPVCGNKLYKKIDGCSSTLQVKCSKCKETLRLDLAFRRRWFSSHFNKYGCIVPWIWTVRHRATGHCRKAMYETRTK